MKPAPFAYLAPQTVEEALAALARGGAEGRALAGGQSLVPMLALRLARPELLGSERMASLVGACQLSYGYVVVDCPPLDPVADAVALQDILDGFLLVIRARRSPRAAIERAVSRLKENRIRGIVFNDQPEVLPLGYAYGYGYRDDRERYLKNDERAESR